MGYPMLKNSAQVVRFPIFDGAGGFLTGATPTVKISVDDGTFATSTNSASEIATASGIYKISLTAAETNGDVIQLRITSGGPSPIFREFYTTTRQLSDLAFPTVSGRSLDVSATGEADANVATWLASAVNALVSGRVDASAGAIAANAITATAIASNAIAAAKIASGAITSAKFAADAIDAAAIAAGAIDAATFAAGAIASAAIAADLDVYTAFVWMTRDSATPRDRYSIIWFKNGAPITSGITVPVLTVTDEANSVLVSAVTPTQVSTLGWYIWDEATNRITLGVNYMAKVTATIDAGTRTWETPLITRDA